MGIMGTYQKVAIIDTTNSGIHLETFDSREALLLGLLEACDPAELVRFRTVVIPAIEVEQAFYEAKINAASETDDDVTD